MGQRFVAKALFSQNTRSVGRRFAAGLCVLTIFITPQVMDSDNLKPEWPMLDPKDHKIIPILPDELDEEY